jgi:hypothetical protein
MERRCVPPTSHRAGPLLPHPALLACGWSGAGAPPPKHGRAGQQGCKWLDAGCTARSGRWVEQLTDGVDGTGVRCIAHANGVETVDLLLHTFEGDGLSRGLLTGVAHGRFVL